MIRHAPDPARPKCVHCRVRLQCRARGLCFACHLEPKIRRLYEPKPPRGEYGSTGSRDEMTEAELDEMIEQQRKCLPAWWREERPFGPRDR